MSFLNCMFYKLFNDVLLNRVGKNTLVPSIVLHAIRVLEVKGFVGI